MLVGVTSSWWPSEEMGPRRGKWQDLRVLPTAEPTGTHHSQAEYTDAPAEKERKGPRAEVASVLEECFHSVLRGSLRPVLISAFRSPETLGVSWEERHSHPGLGSVEDSRHRLPRGPDLICEGVCTRISVRAPAKEWQLRCEIIDTLKGHAAPSQDRPWPV